MGKYISSLVMMVSGCAHSTPPVDIAGTYVIVFCLINCPVTTMNADEGYNTDAMAQEPVHILSETVRAIKED